MRRQVHMHTQRVVIIVTHGWLATPGPHHQHNADAIVVVVVVFGLAVVCS